MKRRLLSFSIGTGRGSSTDVLLPKRLLPSMAETSRKYTVPFSSLANALELVVDEEIDRGRPLNPISISNMNLHILPFHKDILSKGLLSSVSETFRTHDWPLLLKYTVPLSSMELVYDKEIDRGSHLKPKCIYKKDLKLPSFLKEWQFSSMLQRLLPSMAETFKTKDWSLLRKFSSMDSKLDIEDALKSELVAICVWFLFTEVPPHVKACIARTLIFISLGTLNFTKMSVDQTDIENLVVRILSSGNTKVQRQVCLALYVLGGCPSRRLPLNFSAGIQDQLLHLVRNLSCNPDMTYHVLSAVVGVSLVAKGMREKIIETELLHSWLVKLLSRKDDFSIMEDACRTVAFISGERCDSELWDHVKEKLLPPIINGLCCERSNVRLIKVVADAFLKITKYASSDQINDLVEIGGLKYLVHICSRDDENENVLERCHDAIDNILRVGETKAKAKVKAKAEAKGYEEFEFELEQEREPEEVEDENEYASMIDDYYVETRDGDLDGWEILLLNRSSKDHEHPLVLKGERLVQKYRRNLCRYPIFPYW